MKITNNFQSTEWKEKVIAFIFISIWLVMTYKLVIEPYNEIQNQKNQKISLEIKIKKSEKELKETEKKYKIWNDYSVRNFSCRIFTVFLFNKYKKS